MKAQQILDKLIQFNTVDDKDNLEINQYLAGLLQPKGFKIQYVKNKQSKKLNLLAKYNRRKPILTFSGHTDTVPATKSWTFSPFKLSQKGNKLYGLGTSDMKGPIATFVSAVVNSDLPKLKKGLNLAFTYGEETDLRGIQDLLKKVKLKSKHVIVAEDTGLTPVSASKGAYVIKIEFLGKEAHGADADKGVNSILLAQKFIDRIKKYFEKLKETQDELFETPFATINIAKIFGGDLINRVPAYCCLEFEYRTINNNQGIKIYQQTLEILRSLKCRFNIKLDLQIPPMLNDNKKFIASIEEIAQKKALGTNGTTEGTFYCQQGYDTVILGPGNNLAHQPDEYITKEQLAKGEKMYQQIIAKYCS